MFQQCPNCSSDISGANEYCPTCGLKLNKHNVFSSQNDNNVNVFSTTIVHSSFTIRCKHCGEDFQYTEGTTPACPRCGTPLDLAKLEAAQKALEEFTKNHTGTNNVFRSSKKITYSTTPHQMRNYSTSNSHPFKNILLIATVLTVILVVTLLLLSKIFSI